MSKKDLWWEPDNLSEQEEIIRKELSEEDYVKGGDFGSYKGMKEGIDPQKVNLKAHNVYQEQKLKKWTKDYFKLIRREKKHNPNNIADLGCGLGFTTQTLKNFYIKSSVYGYEISHDAVEYAKKNFPTCYFEQKKIEPSSNLSKNNFDLIICQEFYPFTRTRDVEVHHQWCNFLVNNLNKGGIAIISLISSNENSINYSFEKLKNDFSLRRFTLADPRISSILPLYFSRLVGKISFLTWKKLGREIYLLKK